jgi:hypothetical protein
MFNNKIKLLHFFKSKNIIDTADLIAIRIEKSEEYYICKMRGGSLTNTFISEVEFRSILSLYKKPIVLSDDYIDLTEFLNN